MSEVQVPEGMSMSEGWGKPTQSRKFHYFIEGRSLCRNWGWWAQHGPLDNDTGKTNTDDCAACARKMEKRRKESC